MYPEKTIGSKLLYPLVRKGGKTNKKQRMLIKVAHTEGNSEGPYAHRLGGWAKSNLRLNRVEMLKACIEVGSPHLKGIL